VRAVARGQSAIPGPGAGSYQITARTFIRAR